MKAIFVGSITYIRKVMNQNHLMTEKTFTSTNTFAYFLLGYLLIYVKRKRTMVLFDQAETLWILSPIIKAAFIVYFGIYAS